MRTSASFVVSFPKMSMIFTTIARRPAPSYSCQSLCVASLARIVHESGSRVVDGGIAVFGVV